MWKLKKVLSILKYKRSKFDVDSPLNSATENHAFQPNMINLHEAISNAEEIEKRANTIATRATKVAYSLGEALEKLNELLDLFTSKGSINTSNDIESLKVLNFPVVAMGAEALSIQFNSTYSSMLDVEIQSTQVEKKTSELIENSKKIETILETIGEIAFQTKMLSFNATIEAARAGESGKSFVVVAQAVKDLADRTESATKQIQTIVNENKSLSTDTGVSAKKTLEIIKSATGSTSESKKKLDVLTKTIRTISDKQSNELPNLQGSINEAYQAANANKNAPQELVPISKKIQGYLKQNMD